MANTGNLNIPAINSIKKDAPQYVISGGNLLFNTLVN